MADAALHLVTIAWLAAASYLDVRFRRLPSAGWNAVPLLMASAVAAARGGWAAAVAVWMAVLLPRSLAPMGALALLLAPGWAVPILAAPAIRAAWERGWLGGADGCALLALLLLFPDVGMILALLVGMGAVWVAFRLRGERRFPGLLALLAAAALRALTGWANWLS